MPAPVELGLLHLQVCRPLVDEGLADADGYLEVEGIDDVEHVALVDELVVGHPQLHDFARNLRRDIGDLHAHAAVPRPGRGDIVLPGCNRYQDGDQSDGKSGKMLADASHESLGGLR